MSYDQWKTTEPDPNENEKQCPDYGQPARACRCESEEEDETLQRIFLIMQIAAHRREK